MSQHFDPIQTDRLILRDLVEDDWRAVHAYASDPEVVRYMPFGPNTERQSKEFVEKSIAEQRADPRVNYALALTLRETGDFIGGATVAGEAGIPGGDAGLGYCLDRSAWGKGYATEAARALIEFAFESLGAHRVHAGCDTRNTASARVLEKVGMRYEESVRHNVRLRDGWRDSYHYAILEDEWRAKR